MLEVNDSEEDSPLYPVQQRRYEDDSVMNINPNTDVSHCNRCLFLQLFRANLRFSPGFTVDL